MDETLIKRIMPNSLEAEQSVVGSMIMDKDAIVSAMEMLIKEDFYHKQYGILFESMVELYSEGQPVDLVTLQNKSKEKDVPKEVSSLEFIRDLVTAVPTSANVKYYANIVKENAIKRKLIHVTEDIENECYAGKESLESVLNKTEKDIILKHMWPTNFFAFPRYKETYILTLVDKSNDLYSSLYSKSNTSCVNTDE